MSRVRVSPIAHRAKWARQPTEHDAPFCAQCLSAAGPFMLRPYGKDKALVRICERCENEHPRSGRYSFSEATREIPKINGHHTKLRR